VESTRHIELKTTSVLSEGFIDQICLNVFVN
jgi:hypothetical protein